jgi:hypothetical protein
VGKERSREEEGPPDLSGVLIADPMVRRALANLLGAVEDAVAYDWVGDNDAVKAMKRLAQAFDEYGVVQRLALDVADQPGSHVSREGKRQ